MRFEGKQSFNEGAAQEVFNSRFWYLAQLKPGGFDRAVTNLNRQGFQTFMPLRETTLRRNGRMAAAHKPLFPGYVFTQVKPEQRHWRAINSTFGIARLVSLRGGLPTEVPADLMEDLYTRTDTRGVMLPPQDLKAGDTVRIIAGPFAQQIAEIEAVKADERVVLFLQLMGRTVRTQITPAQLEPV